MKNRPWKTWKTRKVTFIAICILWLVTAILGLAGHPAEQGIIDFIYKGGVWLSGFGVALVVSDKVGEALIKRGSNDDGEDY